MTRTQSPFKGKDAHLKAAQARARALLVKSVAREELAKAKTDYAAIRLSRRKEAADARQHILELCHPLQLHPESEWHPEVLNPSPTSVFFMIVACKDGQVVSIPDGRSTFCLHKWTAAKHGGASWPPVTSCFLAYPSAIEAIGAKLPSHGPVVNAPKMLIRVLSRGQAYKHINSNAWALSQVKTLDLLTQISATTPLDVHYALNPVNPDPAPSSQHLRTSTARLPITSTRLASTPSQPTTSGIHIHATSTGSTPRMGSLSPERRLRMPSPHAPPPPPLLAAVAPHAPEWHHPQWSPPVQPETLMSSRAADQAPTSPPRPPFTTVVPTTMISPGRSTSPAIRRRSVSPQPVSLPGRGAEVRAVVAAAGSGVKQGAGGKAGVGKGPGVAAAPSWYLHSAPEKGAEGFAARFHDNRPLNQRVDVKAGIDQLYRDVGGYVNKALKSSQAQAQ